MQNTNRQRPWNKAATVCYVGRSPGTLRLLRRNLLSPTWKAIRCRQNVGTCADYCRAPISFVLGWRCSSAVRACRQHERNWFLLTVVQFDIFIFMTREMSRSQWLLTTVESLSWLSFLLLLVDTICMKLSWISILSPLQQNKIVTIWKSVIRVIHRNSYQKITQNVTCPSIRGVGLLFFVI